MPMKVLVLAAGYGTRLEQGIRDDTTGKFSHLIGVPKPLVPLGSKPLIDYWLDDVVNSGSFSGPSDVYVVCNGKNHFMFAEWARERNVPEKNIYSDGTMSNETRIGAIGDIQLMLDTFPDLMNNDLMIIGGDTLFYEDFSIYKVISAFNKRDDNLVLWYKTEETKSTGILVTDDNNIVQGALEKPDPADTPSRKACPCFYMYRQSTLPLVRQYLDQCKEQKERDAPGHLIPWLCSRSPIFAYEIEGRFDIGGLPSYIEANEFFLAQDMKKERKSNLQKLAVAVSVAAVVVGALLWRRKSKQ